MRAHLKLLRAIWPLKGDLKSKVWATLHPKDAVDLYARVALQRDAWELCYYLTEQRSDVWGPHNTREYSHQLPDQTILRIQYTKPPLTTMTDEYVLSLEEVVDGEVGTVSKFTDNAQTRYQRYHHLEANPDASMGMYDYIDGERVAEITHLHWEDMQETIKESPIYFYDKHLKPLEKAIPGINLLYPVNRFAGFVIPTEGLESVHQQLTELLQNGLNGKTLLRVTRFVQEMNRKYMDEAVEFGERLRERDQVEQPDTPPTSQPTQPKQPEYSPASEQPAGHGVAGYRRDINLSVRSAWEANVARVFIHQGKQFTYEPETFTLPVPSNMHAFFGDVKNIGYIPDFHITGTNEYYEVKGEWYNYRGQEAMAKVVLFQMVHPDKVLNVIGVPEYRKLTGEYKQIIEDSPTFAGWERGSRKTGYNLATKPDVFG